jgi:hypothetical protein
MIEEIQSKGQLPDKWLVETFETLEICGAKGPGLQSLAITKPYLVFVGAW